MGCGDSGGVGGGGDGGGCGGGGEGGGGGDGEESGSRGDFGGGKIAVHCGGDGLKRQATFLKRRAY